MSPPVDSPLVNGWSTDASSPGANGGQAATVDSAGQQSRGFQTSGAATSTMTAAPAYAQQQQQWPSSRQSQFPMQQQQPQPQPQTQHTHPAGRSQQAAAGLVGLAPQQQQQHAAALTKPEAPKTVRVQFWLKYHVEYGQVVRIIGSHDQLGAWNLGKTPVMQWSEGDLWQVSLELPAGGVYEYKYVVVDSASGSAAGWQRGSNNVLALQPCDSDVEVYDNWRNTPGTMVVSDGAETTRERKLLSWAGDMATQRAELRRTRLELAQAREEIRVLRAELGVLRMEVAEAGLARADSDARRLQLERENQELRLLVASSQAHAKVAVQEVVRLLGALDAEPDEPLPPPPSELAQVRVGGGNGNSNGNGNAMFGLNLGGVLGFNSGSN